MATYKRLTLPQRYQIQTLHHQHQTQIQIAQQIGVSQSTVSRELAKHGQLRPRQAYDAQQAQQRAGKARKRTPYKLKGPQLTTVLARLRDRLSPEKICDELERKTTKRVLHMDWNLPLMNELADNLKQLLILLIRTTVGNGDSTRTPMRGGPCRLIRQFIPKDCLISIV